MLINTHFEHNMQTTNLSPLPDTLLRPWVQQALAEDLGRRGDITSQAIFPAAHQSTFVLKSRRSGIIAGMQLARLAFAEMAADIVFNQFIADGQHVTAGTILAKVSGPTVALLSAERSALNYLTHLSGIATATAQLCQAVKDYNCRITCTRKTIPHLRALHKYAVRAGGGLNHRLGLDDVMLIKDNHIAAAGGINEAITKAKQAAGPLIPIEIEVDNLTQLAEVLANPVQLVLLDNMDSHTLKQAVAMCRGKILTEASGGITPTNVVEVAQSGVDYIAVGWLTHSSQALDIGFDSK